MSIPFLKLIFILIYYVFWRETCTGFRPIQTFLYTRNQHILNVAYNLFLLYKTSTVFSLISLELTFFLDTAGQATQKLAAKK